MHHFRQYAAAAFGLGIFLAAGATPAAAEGIDAAVLACPGASCHGTDGRAPGVIPSIAGRPEAVLKAQLTAFKNAPPPGTTVMNRLIKGHSDEQIDALAKYFAQIKPAPTAAATAKGKK